jgi:uncharacterized protein YjbI with pentapeptide repeats
LHRCCLRGVVAAGSRWRDARLVEADFRSGLDQLTDLGQADFQGADLSFALMQQLQLHGADLRGCDLRYTQLSGDDRRGALLDGALLPAGH